MKKFIFGLLLCCIFQFQCVSNVVLANDTEVSDETPLTGEQTLLLPLKVRNYPIDTVMRGNIIATLPQYLNIVVLYSEVDNWYRVEWYSSIDKRYKQGYVSDLALHFAVSKDVKRLERENKYLQDRTSNLYDNVTHHDNSLDSNLIIQKANELLRLSFIKYNFLEQLYETKNVLDNDARIIFAMAYCAKASANIQLENYEEALKDINNAISYRNDIIYFRAIRGTVYYYLGYYDKAKREFIIAKNNAIKTNDKNFILEINEVLNSINRIPLSK